MATTLPTDIVMIAITASALTQAALACTEVVWSAAAATNGKPKMKTRRKEAKPAAFGPAAMKAVTGVGAPSYTSGVQTWKGAVAILNPKPTSIIAAPAKSSAGYITSPATTRSPSCAMLV